MPNGIFPVPAFKTVPPRQASARSPLRVRTRWQRNQLDEQIASGAETTASAELNLRAAQLRSNAERERIANALAEAVGESRRGDPVTVRVKPHRTEVRARADELLSLAARLRDDLPVDVRGVAMAARLIDDRKGPLRTMSGRSLQEEIESARQALDTRREIAAGLRAAA
jgi:hypothetical protein